MQQQRSNATFNPLQQEPIDLRKLLIPIIANWYWIILSVIIGVSLAFTYLRYATPVHQVKSTILIRNGEDNALTTGALQKELLGISSDPRIYEDVRILRSRALMEEVVDSLKLNYRLLHVGQVRNTDLYKEGPLVLDSISPPSNNMIYEVRFLDENYYQILIGESTYDGQFGDTTYLPNSKIRLLTQLDSNTVINNEQTYILEARNTKSRAASLLQRFSVNYEKSQPTLLDLFILDEIPERGVHLLNQIIKTYNQLNISDKSRTGENTLVFIDDRIDILATELNTAERALESYKTKENVTLDIATDLPILQQKVSEYERQLVELGIQKSILDYLVTFLEENAYQFIPAIGSGANDNTITNLIGQYNALVIEKNRLQQNVTDDYPAIQLVDEQLKNSKISIEEAVEKAKSDLAIKAKELNTRNESYIQQLNATPRRERELLNIRRQQLIKENLFLYLLEKREEAAISIAATVENAKIIDEPIVTGLVSPKKNSILLGAGLGGLFLPLGIILLITLFDNRIKLPSDIESATAVPLLGNIVESKKQDKLVIRKASRSAIAEMFRLLRTNLEFLLSSSDDRVILLTSTTNQEGKSFICVNLGMSYALSGKKVLLMGFDLRKPKMASYLVSQVPTQGISSYLIGEADTDSIIHKYEDNEQLYYIASGPIPPNPAELILNGQLDTLLKELKQQFDIIIIDSPPVGLVTDSLLLSKYVNASLYVTRFGVTKKNALQLVEQLYQEKKLNNPAIVFNGVKKGGSYGYGYGYGYGYYEEDK